MLKGIRRSKWFDGDEMIDLAQQTFVIPNTFSYKIIEVTSDQIARPDLISIDLYDTDMYGDLICKINNIPNPFELNEGDRLVVPAPESIDDFMANDPYSDEESVTDVKPTVKTKKDKRKANEAIVGDNRFKIDSSNRIVIY